MCTKKIQPVDRLKKMLSHVFLFICFKSDYACFKVVRTLSGRGGGAVG